MGCRKAYVWRSAMAPKMTIVNPAHWIEPNGTFPTTPRLRSRAIRIAQCIEYGANLQPGEARPTLLACRYRPNRRACEGFLWVIMQDDDAIQAACPLCGGDEFLIYEWESTPWGSGLAESIDLKSTAARFSAGPPKRTSPITAHEKLEILSERALTLLGSELTVKELHVLIAHAQSPNEVLKRLLAPLEHPPEEATLDRLLGLVLDLWDHARPK